MRGHISRSRRNSLGIALRPFITYSAAVGALIFLVAPFLWLVITSFMQESEALSVPPHWIPESPTLGNYASFVFPEGYRTFAGARAIEHSFVYVRNSLIVALAVSGLNLLLGTMSAYALARVDFRGGQGLVVFYLASRMVPAVALMIPLYMVMASLQLLDTVLALIVSYTTFTLPFTIWILRSYFLTIPHDLEDAARVDGCNWLTMMLRVFLPVASPALVAAAMFSFMSSWGEFLYAVLFTSSPASRTVTVAVSQFATDIYIEKTLMATGGVLAVVPPLVLAFVFQRMVVQGLVAGSTKG